MALPQSVQSECGHVGIVAPRHFELWAECDDQQNRPALKPVDGPRKQFERCWINPVSIFHDEQHGALLGEAAEEVVERQYRALLLLSGREVECPVAALEGQRQECRQ
jgi:hypothetical protein